MHHLRDSLLSPAPKDAPELDTMDRAFKDRESVEEAAAQGDLDTLRDLALRNRVWIITDRYCSVGDGVDSLEEALHSLWHIFYQLGRYTAYESSEQDRLVLDILRIQGKGPLTRPVSGAYGIDIARTVEGTLWNDLPFLVTDMANFFISDCSSMSGVNRLNFASFLAKLASARISKDRMCQVALVLFRATFEEGRDLRTTDEPDDENQRRLMRSLDLFHLLPAAFAWIKEAGSNLVRLSDVYWNDCPSVVGQGGRLFVQSEFGRRSPTGFTPWRWMFWLKRLHEIQEETKEAGEKRLGEYATDAIELMVGHVEELNSGILRAYRTGGDTLQQDKHLICLRKFLKTEAAEGNYNVN
ncbi:hypothetical protein N7532_006005 [Penicillium argentinense]|uniref:Uncharacterized protein n=1 Tax=Penicillium argentinense TaxID=1131581 RepID=A0A9W9FF90_9EURO|nr:uncharacterized protein N7532_006005 [Penicillium argentinense]KAJ5099004.1 hypothetical protein N7532_006005 [Penicillium argentinense]